ncbi:hypothetical protein [Enterobacter sp. Lyrl_3]|uniref:hypothetical protein n=1 Tax=Enterobacter sp. Lyrl_3 TaxID=3110922 RepID=UPI003F7D5FFE
MTNSIRQYYYSLEGAYPHNMLVVKDGKLQLISSDDFFSGDTSIGVWEVNIDERSLGDEYQATHCLYNPKSDTHIIADNGNASLKEGRCVSPHDLIAYKNLTTGHNASQWLLNDPYHANLHMTAGATNNLVFIEAPPEKCTWVQTPISPY